MTSPRKYGALLIVSLLALTSCSGGDAEPNTTTSGGGEQVSLDYWVYESGGSTSFIDTLISEFEAANPNITIDLTRFPEQNYGVKVQTAIAAGKAPDLVLAFNIDYMRRGLLLPLDQVVADNGLDLSTFNQAIVQGPGEFTCSYQGTLYCLGSSQGGLGMFYNKAMFDAAGIPYPAAWPPMTVEEYADIACRLSNPDEGVWGAAFGSTILPWEMSVSPDGRTVDGYLNGSESVHEFDVLTGIIRDGCAPTPGAMDPWEQATDFFALGKLGMAISDYDSAKTIEKAGIDYGVTGLPTPVGVQPFFDVWSDNTGVLADSAHPQEAMKFIGFLATRGEQIAFDTDGSIPLDNTLAQEVDWAQGIPGRLDALEVLSHARPSVFIPNKWDAWGPFYDAWNYMTDGEKTAQQALDDAVPAIQENLDDAWRVWEEPAT